MKKLVIAAALAVVGCVQTNAQGTVDFRNRITGTLDVPICDLNGVRISGPDFVAQLYFSATETGSYTPATAPPGVAAASPFRSGSGAGYWNPGVDSTRTLPGIQAGSAVWLKVRVWDSTFGPDYATAVAAGACHGVSTSFSVVAGGTTPGGVQIPPAVMLGLSFWGLPEPPNLALSRSGSQLTLTWSGGILESTASLSATPAQWAPVQGATAPTHTITATGTEQYYRVRQ